MLAVLVIDNRPLAVLYMHNGSAFTSYSMLAVMLYTFIAGKHALLPAHHQRAADFGGCAHRML
jgi:hypothetical protein